MDVEGLERSSFHMGRAAAAENTDYELSLPNASLVYKKNKVKNDGFLWKFSLFYHVKGEIQRGKFKLLYSYPAKS